MKNETQKKKGINPLIIGAAGLAVGAGVAATAALAMKNKKVSKNVKRIIEDVKDQAGNYAMNVRDDLGSNKTLKSISKTKPKLKNIVKKSSKK